MCSLSTTGIAVGQEARMDTQVHLNRKLNRLTKNTRLLDLMASSSLPMSSLLSILSKLAGFSSPAALY